MLYGSPFNFMDNLLETQQKHSFDHLTENVYHLVVMAAMWCDGIRYNMTP